MNKKTKFHLQQRIPLKKYKIHIQYITLIKNIFRTERDYQALSGYPPLHPKPHETQQLTIIYNSKRKKLIFSA